MAEAFGSWAQEEIRPSFLKSNLQALPRGQSLYLPAKDEDGTILLRPKQMAECYLKHIS